MDTDQDRIIVSNPDELDEQALAQIAGGDVGAKLVKSLKLAATVVGHALGVSVQFKD